MTFWVAGAVVVGGVASAAIGSSAAQSAADTQAAAAANAQQISQNEFNTITGQEQPFLQSGYGAQSQLNYLLGIGTPGTYNPSTQTTGQTGNGALLPGGAGWAYQTGTGAFLPGGTGPLGAGWATAGQGMPAAGTVPGTIPATAASSPAGGYGSLLTPFTADYMKQYSPAYQFQLQQGQQGVLNQDAASQGALSGAALKDLISYNQNYANTAFGNAFNQYQTQQGNVYSRLMGLSQLGQAAAGNLGTAGTALAGQAAQSATNIGTAQAAGQIGSANAISGGLSSASLPWLYASGGTNPSSVTPPDYQTTDALINQQLTG